MKHYTVNEIEAACRALEAISPYTESQHGVLDIERDALLIIRDGLAEIIQEHKRANEQEPFIPGPIGGKRA